MRTVWFLAVLVALPGCGGGVPVLDTHDPTRGANPDLGPQLPPGGIFRGTEIGEEGTGAPSVACLEAATPLADPSAPAPSFDRAPDALAQDWSGRFSSSEAAFEVEATAEGAVHIARTEVSEDTEGAVFFDTATCEDVVILAARVTFEAGGVFVFTPAATVEVVPYGTGLLQARVGVFDAALGDTGRAAGPVEALPEDPGTLAGLSGPEDFSLSDVATVDVVLDGRSAGPDWDLQALWRGWTGEVDAYGNELAVTEAIWSGTVVAD